tara:strand:- start:990 stop:2405 length:1416 start_codon:yes stop_codon:yes gene_type:complete
MKNKFNLLTSKEWLPFQKSWFHHIDRENLYESNIRFFTKPDKEKSKIFYFGMKSDLIRNLCKKNHSIILEKNEKDQNEIEFAIFDLLDHFEDPFNFNNYINTKRIVIDLIESLSNNIQHRKFITIFMKNLQSDGVLYPYAWDLAKSISSYLSLKDEKIGCIELSHDNIENATDDFMTDNSIYYSLYFRKDELSGLKQFERNQFFQSVTKSSVPVAFEDVFNSWFILKPKPRKKNEKLHPAKYPEDLIEKYIKVFTKVDDNIFDPMSGTGTTQLAALMTKRNGYGCELSKYFCDIANNRCQNYVDSYNQIISNSFKIYNEDARNLAEINLPIIDYIVTSPPYWNMLNMVGAENQAKRKKQGLQLNYSESEKDLGNIQDYDQFLDNLYNIYIECIKLLKADGYITIILKNIKKKGNNYPFAWDLAERLSKKLLLMPESVWCQNDLSIAPYGFGNTWVSNTFHTYCITFRNNIS